MVMVRSHVRRKKTGMEIVSVHVRDVPERRADPNHHLKVLLWREARRGYDPVYSFEQQLHPIPEYDSDEYVSPEARGAESYMRRQHEKLRQLHMGHI